MMLPWTACLTYLLRIGDALISVDNSWCRHSWLMRLCCLHVSFNGTCQPEPFSSAPGERFGGWQLTIGLLRQRKVFWASSTPIHLQQTVLANTARTGHSEFSIKSRADALANLPDPARWLPEREMRPRTATKGSEADRASALLGDNLRRA
jgi:hypothetical protein